MAQLIARLIGPLRILQWYRFRVYANGTIAFGIFLLILLPLLSFNHWIVVPLAVAVAFGCFWFLETLPIYIRCPNSNCRRLIHTGNPWRCGYDRRCENRNVSEYPFVNQCQHCKNIPTGYRCHCKEAIFFTEDRDDIHLAISLDTKLPPVPKPPVIVPSAKEKKITKRGEQLADLKHQFEVTQVKTNIKLEKQRGTEQGEDSGFKTILRRGRTLQDDMSNLEKVRATLEKENERRFPGDMNRDERVRGSAIVERVMRQLFREFDK